MLVVQHEAECPPAWFGEWLAGAGLDLDVRRPDRGEGLPTNLDGHAGMLILGGHMGADDDAEFPWLTAVTQLVRHAAQLRTPTLGICLGHQLVAVALGGSIQINPLGQQLGLIEVGWLSAVSSDALFGKAWPADSAPTRGVQWNHDIVDRLPSGAVTLAQTPRAEIQAARFAPTVWGIQLHPEADDQVVAPWAEADRAAHPEGVVEEALADIASAHDELAAGWRPLAERFAELILTASSTRNTHAP